MKVINTSDIQELTNIVHSTVETDVLLKEISSWRTGGRARVIVQPNSINEIIALREFIFKRKLSSVVIGNTTNLLFTDENIDAVFIRMGNSLSGIKIDGSHVIAEAGVWAPRLSQVVMRAGLTGLEHICGIPGSVGGLTVMNGGSQRKGIGDCISYVKTIDEKGGIKIYRKSECEFSYRRSIFQELNEIVVEVAFDLTVSPNKRAMHSEILAMLRSRKNKFPRRLPNCGSVFVSNPEMYGEYGPPGKVIEECNLKGLIRGGAQVSKKHANFIVNTGSARSEDIIELINIVRSSVFEKTGYFMEVEPKFLNDSGEVKRI